MLAVSTSAALGFASVPATDCPETVHVKEELGFNPCFGRHAYTETLLANSACFDDDMNPAVGPQAGADITTGATGLMETHANQQPIMEEYHEYLDGAMCAVNVHWHMGAEHRSAGQYDEAGSSPEDGQGRALADGAVRHGHKCHHYDTLTEEQKAPVSPKPAPALVHAHWAQWFHPPRLTRIWIGAAVRLEVLQGHEGRRDLRDPLAALGRRRVRHQVAVPVQVL